LHVYLAARHVELTDALRAYVETHLIEPIRSHQGRLKLRHVEIQLFAEGDKADHFGCHVYLDSKGHQRVNVREIQNDLYSAIDLAKDRVVRNIIEIRDRMLTLRRHPKKYSFARLGRALGWIRRYRTTEEA
jgi:ribosomal subunit interface protein